MPSHKDREKVTFARTPPPKVPRWRRYLTLGVVPSGGQGTFYTVHPSQREHVEQQIVEGMSQNKLFLVEWNNPSEADDLDATPLTFRVFIQPAYCASVSLYDTEYEANRGY